MHPTAPSRKSAGFALAEALVALLLLALATIGAGTAMVHSLAGQHSALLRTQAADLAANLAEALRSAPDTTTQEAEIRAWQSAVLLQLPQAQPEALRLPEAQPGLPDWSPAFDIRLQWRDGRSSIRSELVLPLALDALRERP